MLSARAYSFQQTSRLAISLSWVGGFTNVIAFIATQAFVSHMTGNATQLARGVVGGSLRHAVMCAVLLVTFGLGAAASALMTEGAKRRGYRSKYLLPVGAEALLLAALFFLLLQDRAPHFESNHAFLIGSVAAFAMGLQNATITRISGAVVRTTHLTGVITDLGLEGVQLLWWYRDRFRGGKWARAGRVLRITQRHPSALRVALLATIFGSFLFGSIAGAWLFLEFGPIALVAPILFLLFLVAMDLRSPIADVKELDALDDPELAASGIVRTLLPSELGIYRFAAPPRGSHRPPDFQLWIDRVPRQRRVVILAVSPLTRFTENAVLDLHAASQSLATNQRTLIVAGITPRQFKELDAVGVAGRFDTENLCPDLEFAIARGLAVLHDGRNTPDISR